MSLLSGISDLRVGDSEQAIFRAEDIRNCFRGPPTIIEDLHVDRLAARNHLRGGRVPIGPLRLTQEALAALSPVAIIRYSDPESGGGLVSEPSISLSSFELW